MFKLIRSWRVLICLSLLTLTLTLAIPALARLPMAKTLIVKASDNALNLMTQGRVAYEAGKYTEAITAWQQAEREYRQQGDLLRRASSLNYLSLAHQELGQWQEAEKCISQSLQFLPKQSELKNENLLVLSQALNIKGSIQLATGKPEAALETWQQATSTYQNANDEMGAIGSQINQAQALQTMGLHRRSQKILEQIEQQIDTHKDPLLKAKVLHGLGMTLQTIGNLDRSEQVLQQSLDIAQKFNLLEVEAATLFSLGNTAKLKEDPKSAIAFYQQAAATTAQSITEMEAQLNLLSSLIATEQWQQTQPLLRKIQANLLQLSPSRPTIYARVNFSKNLIDLEAKNTELDKHAIDIKVLLQETLALARQIEDRRAESATLGTLGHVYERQQQWAIAREVTEQALNLAQTLNATDLAYQWQWQLGRLLHAQGDSQDAIASYTAAVNNLQSLRISLVAVNPDAQFSFRESVEPVYRELVELLLDGNPNQAQLQQAREVIESLQLAELENFFQEACLEAQPKQIDEIDASAAVIYPIILGDRLAVILSLPDGSLRHYSTSLPEAEVENTIENLYQSLNPIFSNQQRLQLSQQVYDWLIRPAEADLTQHGIKTLAFVLDGGLRKLPMAVLYDGEQYAIEKYNIALTPGLQLLPSQGLQLDRLKAIIAGVSESNQGFASLPGVETEVAQISTRLSSQLLLNQEFTKKNLQQELQETSAPLVHLATHGQFSSDPENTFIVTWNDRIKVNEFATLLRTRETTRTNPVDLMVLSACQTASGDKQAALGLAGVAVRSGARTTLATLWSVKDNATTLLMSKFYQELLNSQPDLNKGAALRQAQLALINSEEYDHPFYWAAFVLVGNWL